MGPCGGGCDRGLPVRGETAATSTPCEGAFDDPSAGQDLEALGGVRLLDDFDGPCAHIDQSVLELVAGMAAIGKDTAQPREALAHGDQHIDRPVAVLNIIPKDVATDSV
jgi:hypothetical protein